MECKVLNLDKPSIESFLIGIYPEWNVKFFGKSVNKYLLSLEYIQNGM